MTKKTLKLETGFALIPIFIIGIIIIVLGGAVWTYRNTIQFTLNPEGETTEAIQDLTEIKTLHFKGSFGIDIPKAPESNGVSSQESQGLPAVSSMMSFLYGGKITIEYEGDIDRQDPLNPKNQMVLKLIFTGEGMSISLKVETKSIGDFIFVKLAEVPLLGFLSAAESYTGKWWKIDLGPIREAQAKQKEMLKEQLKTLSPEEKEKMEKYLRTQEEEAKKLIERIRELIAKTDFFSGFEKIGREKIEGVSTFHVKRFLNKKGLVSLAMESTKIIQGSLFSGVSPMGAGLQDPELVRLELEKSVAKFPDVPIHLWIGTKDGNLYQIQPDLAGISKESNINITLTLTRHNQPVVIEAPADAQEFDLSSFLNLSYTPAIIPPLGGKPSELEETLQIEPLEPEFPTQPSPTPAPAGSWISKKDEYTGITFSYPANWNYVVEKAGPYVFTRKDLGTARQGDEVRASIGPFGLIEEISPYVPDRERFSNLESYILYLIEFPEFGDSSMSGPTEKTTMGGKSVWRRQEWNLMQPKSDVWPGERSWVEKVYISNAGNSAYISVIFTLVLPADFDEKEFVAEYRPIFEEFVKRIRFPGE